LARVTLGDKRGAGLMSNGEWMRREFEGNSGVKGTGMGWKRGEEWRGARSVSERGCKGGAGRVGRMLLGIGGAAALDEG
jgi:hypothetical protein